MDETIIAALIAAVPPSILAGAAFYQSWKAHEAVNSRMTELLEITRAKATSDATLAEKEAEAERKIGAE